MHPLLVAVALCMVFQMTTGSRSALAKSPVRQSVALPGNTAPHAKAKTQQNTAPHAKAVSRTNKTPPAKAKTQKVTVPLAKAVPRKNRTPYAKAKIQKNTAPNAKVVSYKKSVTIPAAQKKSASATVRPANRHLAIVKAKVGKSRKRKPPAPLILIDPGHGGHDPGAMAAGAVEKDITLRTAKQLRLALLKAGFRVKLTRSTDKSLSLKARVRMAARLKPQLFLSLHCNSAPRASEKGLETFAYLPRKLHNGRGSVVPMTEVCPSSESAIAAQDIHECLATRLKQRGVRDNGTRLGRFAVLTPTPWPSVLIEMGYLTNASDAKRLTSPRYRAWFSAELAEVVLSRFNAEKSPLFASFKQLPAHAVQ